MGEKPELLRLELQRQKEAHMEEIHKWENRLKQCQRRTDLCIETKEHDELSRVTDQLAETEDKLRHYICLAETLEDENKKLADMLERRNDEWKSEIQILERSSEMRTEGPSWIQGEGRRDQHREQRLE